VRWRAPAWACPCLHACSRARIGQNVPLGKKSPTLTGAVFVLTPQALELLQENSLTYGESASGSLNPLSFTDPEGLQASTAVGAAPVVLPAVGAACSTGVGCAAVAVGAVGVGSYWLTDRYVNPWAQPLITKAIDACTPSKSNEREKECSAQLERDEAECLVAKAGYGRRAQAVCLAKAKEYYAQCLRGK
jgi:hypothetical protein